MQMMGKKRIGFVGLGLMGSGMAGNLLAAGYPVTGYDVDRGRMDAFVGKGGRKAATPADILPGVDAIILSLPNSSVVNAVVADSLKLFATGRAGLVLIDTTTADPVMSAELASRLRVSGIEMLDATISGTSKMCAEKDVTFMIGGDEDTFKAYEPLFSVLGKEIFYLGKNGSGASAKLIVNLVLGLNRMVLAEGLCLAEKAGMDPARTLELLKMSAAYSKAMDMKGSKMIERDFLPPEGKLAFHLKDVRLMLDLGGRLDVPLLLSSLHVQALTAEVAKGRGEWDNSAIIAFYNDLAGL
jgi:3-hydroxyisobutyrate dehydrogenase-like beta-hydroxyacid dehydrogenase